MPDETPPMARPRVAAGMLFRDTDDRLLLVKPTYKEGWDIPGGYVEPDETPAQAAAREVSEELGLQRSVGRLLVVDWAPHPQEGDKLLFVFDGGVLSPGCASSLVLPENELEKAEFWPAQALPAQTPMRLVQRLCLASQALSNADTIYAENGCRMGVGN